jgi:thiamine biosynthesis lipoprotein
MAPVLAEWPADERLAAALALTGADRILEDPDRSALGRARAGVVIDLGGMAKGVAADLAAGVLAARGVENALINLGGKLRIMGSMPDGGGGSPWRVNLIDPLGGPVRYAADVSGRAVASFGNYGSFFTFRGQRRSHVIDPRTGEPFPDVTFGATVVHPDSAAAADSLASVFCVLGREGAESFLREKAQISPGGLDVVIFGQKEDGGLETAYFRLLPGGELEIAEP